MFLILIPWPNFKFVIIFTSENIYTNLNYSVFLYNQGDRQGSASKLTNFRRHFESIIQGKSKDIDPEVKL